MKSLACNRGLWEDLGNGYITKKPKKKKTSVQIINDTEPNDKGIVRLKVNPLNAGPIPRIYYAEDASVSRQSSILKDQFLYTNALRVNFLVADPSNQYETGEPVSWYNKLVIRNRLFEDSGKRKIELFVAPKGNIRYTLDGSEPREGTTYKEPIVINDGDVLLRVFAECDGLETKDEFRFPAKGQKGVQIDDTKPTMLVNNRGGKKLDSRNKTFCGLKEAKEKSISFENITLTVGQGAQAVQVMVGDINVAAEYIESILISVLNQFDPSTPITMTFRKAHFASGHDLKRFAETLEIDIQQDEVEQ